MNVAAKRIIQLIQNKSYRTIDSTYLANRQYYYKKYSGAPPSIYWDTQSRKGFELALGENSPFFNHNELEITNDTVNYICSTQKWSKAGVFISKDPNNFNFDAVMLHRNKYDDGSYSEAEISFAKKVKTHGYRVVLTEFSLVFWLIVLDNKWQLYAVDFDVFCSL